MVHLKRLRSALSHSDPVVRSLAARGSQRRWDNLPAPGLILLLAGGAAYTFGVPFYLPRRMRWHHPIWHVFVLAGSALQYLAVLLYAVPHAG